MGIMNNEVLEQVLEDQVAAINGMDDGTDEKTAAVKEFEIMNKVYLDRYSAANEILQMRRDDRDKIIGYVFEGIKVVGIAALVVGSTIVGYKFEETGTQTSQTFKRVQDWIWKFAKM